MRYDEITARVDAVAATRAAKLLDRFQALEHALTTLRGHLEAELNIPEVMEVTEQTCEQCIHWEGGSCDLGFPDPQEEGIVFARWCSSYRPS
jgi:hypothetical protein